MISTVTAAPALPLSTLPAVESLKRAAKELSEALRAILGNVASPATRPQQLARELGINRALASQLLNALKAQDPLASINQMPRSEGLRILLNAVKSRVDRALMERARAGLQSFEELLDSQFGGWSGLETTVSDWLPDVRSKFEMTNKQGAYRCMANLRGVQTDVDLSIAIYHPSAVADRIDVASICGLGGLRRLRYSAKICFATIGSNLYDMNREPISMAGVGPAGAETYPLLDDFSSSPVPGFEVEKIGNTINYMIRGSALGPESAMSLYAACVSRRARPLWHAEAPLRIGPQTGLNVPAKVLLFYLLVHDDVCPGADPQLLIYDTVRAGRADPNDPASEVDRLHMLETVQPLGRGVAAMRAAEIANVAEMTAYVCDKLGWDTQRLRGYRCRVRYPLYNAQYCLMMDVPPAPAGTA